MQIPYVGGYTQKRIHTNYVIVLCNLSTDSIFLFVYKKIVIFTHQMHEILPSWQLKGKAYLWTGVCAPVRGLVYSGLMCLPVHGIAIHQPVR